MVTPSKSVGALAIVIGLSIQSEGVAAQVWQSTFDTTADGVVNMFTNNPGTVMIGPNTGGRQAIRMDERGTVLGNKAGRPLGSTVQLTQSFSGLYKFHYVSIVEGSGTSEGAIHVGFLGANSVLFRQIMGARILRRQIEPGVQNITLGGIWKGADVSGFSFAFGNNTQFNINTIDLLGQELYFAVGFDATTEVLTLGLFKSDGTLLSPASKLSQNIRLMGAAASEPPSSLQAEINSVALTHLGFSDGFNDTVGKIEWSVDSLTYFDDADGAFDVLAGACCHPDATCSELVSAVACGDGTFQGIGVACASVTCPLLVGACCHDDGTCTEGTGAECTAGTFQGEGSTCAGVECPVIAGACCQNDGTCVDGVTAGQCLSLGGTYNGEGTTCGAVNCPVLEGACCKFDNTCVDGIVEDQCINGTFQGTGTDCVSNPCPDLTGACCKADGTCEDGVLVYECTGGFQGTGSSCGTSTCLDIEEHSGFEWESTFDTDADGVVNVRANNPNSTAIIGPNTGGRQTIITQELNQVTSVNKAGRLLGNTKTLNDSISALYTFTWPRIEDDDLGNGSGAIHIGFLGDQNQSIAQFLGTRILRRFSPDSPPVFDLENQPGRVFLSLGALWMGDRLATTPFSFAWANNVEIEIRKEALVGRPLQLAIGYNGETKILRLGLYDGVTGEAITTFSRDIRTFETIAPAPPNDPNLLLEMDSVALTHLGFSDGFDSDNNLDTEWSVDSLMFFSDADSAFGFVVSNPASACCAPGSCSPQSIFECPGSWHGPDITCGPGLCPCNDPVFDVNGDTFVDLQDLNDAPESFVNCATGPTPAPAVFNALSQECRCLDINGDSAIDINDFGVFQRCFSGTHVPAATDCDN